MIELFLAVLVIAVVGYWTYQNIQKTVDAENQTTADAASTLNKCGCGRSSTGFCVGLHQLSDEEWAVHEDHPNRKKPRKTRAKKSAE